MTRQEANYKILESLKLDSPEYNHLYDDIKKLISQFQHQRFGQIICNYVCPDYRFNPSEVTKDIMNKWFDIDFDPFFEESTETLNRLKDGFKTIK